MKETARIDLARESPFLTIWTRPRATMRAIVDTNPSFRVLPIAMVGGVLQAIQLEASIFAGEWVSISTLLVIAVVFGPLVGVALLYLGAWLVELSCRLLRGEADSREVRSVHRVVVRAHTGNDSSLDPAHRVTGPGTFHVRQAELLQQSHPAERRDRVDCPGARAFGVVDGGYGQSSRRGAAFLGLEGVQLDAIADRASDDSHCDPGNWSRLSSDEAALLKRNRSRNDRS